MRNRRKKGRYGDMRENLYMIYVYFIINYTQMIAYVIFIYAHYTLPYEITTNTYM
jgi:hypothetical protein